MRNLLTFLLLWIQVPVMSQIINLAPYLEPDGKPIGYNHRNGRSQIVTGLLNAEFITAESYKKIGPNLQQALVDDRRLTP